MENYKYVLIGEDEYGDIEYFGVFDDKEKAEKYGADWIDSNDAYDTYDEYCENIIYGEPSYEDYLGENDFWIEKLPYNPNFESFIEKEKLIEELMTAKATIINLERKLNKLT